MGGDDHAFDELVRVVLDDVAVLERARLGLVGVAQHVARAPVWRRHERPLDPGRETGTSPPAKARGLDLVYDLLGRHGRESLTRGVVPSVLAVEVERMRPV